MRTAAAFTTGLTTKKRAPSKNAPLRSDTLEEYQYRTVLDASRKEQSAGDSSSAVAAASTTGSTTKNALPSEGNTLDSEDLEDYHYQIALEASLKEPSSEHKPAPSATTSGIQLQVRQLWCLLRPPRRRAQRPNSLTGQNNRKRPRCQRQ